MPKKLLFALLLGLLLSGCRPLNGTQPSSAASASPSPAATNTDVPPPTRTPVPTATMIPTPTADFSVVGLPQEQPGTTAFDFVAEACGAEWFSSSQDLPCPAANETQLQLGYAMPSNGQIEGLPLNLAMLLTYPPQYNDTTLYSKYPVFTVEKGDRFRAVLACRSHAFCDVTFGLEYYDGNDKRGLKHWSYLFADAPLVIDYSLDGLAGKTVRFGLTFTGAGNRQQAYGVWIVPHIYRPTP